MLRVVIPERVLGYDETSERFITAPEKEYFLEHSLYAMSLWEGETRKCFLSSQIQGDDFVLYVRCMADMKLPEEDAIYIKNTYGNTIIDYIMQDRVAMKFVPKKTQSQKETTSGANKFTPTEKIYATLIEMGIPFSVEHWHFSRLNALLKEINRRNKKSKGMSPAQWNTFGRINQSRLNGG